jgi:DNA helicase-2/ATP-dependent DNA helicase PcrA
MISLSGLNDEQRQAAEVVDGPQLILAGAGSGKTRTITYRIAHMVDNLNIPAKEILGVSFTNKASKEMRVRVINLLGRKKSKGLTLTTFHALGVKILREDITKLGYQKSFSIYDTSDQMAIIRDALKHFKSQKDGFDRKIVQSKISKLKNLGISADDFADSPYFDGESAYDHAINHCYEYYQDKLKFFNAIDFDDILHLCVQLFQKFPELCEKYSDRYRYIMIDEYQDTNNLQFQMVVALTKSHNCICVVGDDDQSIYAFRGADLTNIMNFEKQYPGAKVVKLEENYRSTSTILSLANKMIAQNKHRKDKTLRTKIKSNIKPLLWAMGNTDHEAEVVVEDIVQLQALGTELSEIAVLYRSNTQCPPLEDQLRMSQVPYTIVGGQKFYDKKEIKDLMAYLFLILNPRDEISLRRILNVPNRGIGNITLQKYLNLASDKNITLFKTLESAREVDPKRSGNILNFLEIIETCKGHFNTLSLSEAIEKMVDEISFFKFIEKSHDSAKIVEFKKNDVANFIASAERFTKLNPGNATLKDFSEKLLLQDSQDNESNDDDEKDNSVTLMTLHSSKGLEFDNVFMLGIEEELLPHKRTIAEGEDISEERRLCYVGITRARKRLIMTYCKERNIYGRDVPRLKSRFLSEIEDHLLFEEQDRTTFGHMDEGEIEDYKKSFFGGLLDSLDK